jgi:hypothetical protein
MTVKILKTKVNLLGVNPKCFTDYFQKKSYYTATTCFCLPNTVLPAHIRYSRYMD